MSLCKLLTAELAFRWPQFLLSVLAVAVAAALVVASPLLLQYYQAETQAQMKAEEVESKKELAKLEDDTRKAMLLLGFNLRIVHRDADLTKMRTEFKLPTMPQEHVDRIAQSPKMTKVAHLVASLWQLIQFDNQPRLLVGYAPEAPQADSGDKKPMGLIIQPGTVVLGHDAGQRNKVGDTITILDKPFRVAHVLPAHGTNDDIMLAVSLSDAQTLFDKPGQISEILALSCRCKTDNPIEEITAQLREVLPEVKIDAIAPAMVVRDQQRGMVNQHHQQTLATLRAERQSMEDRLALLVNVITPAVVGCVGLWIAILAYLNVRQRRTEVGLLRALGKGSTTIAGLFLGKSLLLGLIGGAVGAVIGLALVGKMSSDALTFSSESLRSFAVPLSMALLGAPLLAAAAGYLPTLLAIVQDPAAALREE